MASDTVVVRAIIEKHHSRLPFGFDFRGGLVGALFRIELCRQRSDSLLVFDVGELSMLGSIERVEERLDFVLEHLVKTAERVELLGIEERHNTQTTEQWEQITTRAATLHETLSGVRA